mmetsp:Transcript_13698/g.34887  ORF Transcript_13698/g.34887 Transcript_13698/m.34887 type:complete len:252 (-) Transcript_13698:912-1667(-)
MVSGRCLRAKTTGILRYRPTNIAGIRPVASTVRILLGMVRSSRTANSSPHASIRLTSIWWLMNEETLRMPESSTFPSRSTRSRSIFAPGISLPAPRCSLGSTTCPEPPFSTLGPVNESENSLASFSRRLSKAADLETTSMEELATSSALAHMASPKMRCVPLTKAVTEWKRATRLGADSGRSLSISSSTRSLISPRKTYRLSLRALGLASSSTEVASAMEGRPLALNAISAFISASSPIVSEAPDSASSMP